MTSLSGGPQIITLRSAKKWALWAVRSELMLDSDIVCLEHDGQTFFSPGVASQLTPGLSGGVVSAPSVLTADAHTT